MATKGYGYFYFLDENGNIQAIMPKVKPDTNADEILALI